MRGREVEVLVIGGGPAGLAAAIAAREAGAEVVLVDERPTLGGQIYKRLPSGFDANSAALGADYAAGAQLIATAQASGAELQTGTTAWGVWGRTVAIVDPQARSTVIEAQQLILATGAYDRPVVFPGWTLPGVITAGGAQALAKIQRLLPGERVLVAGSGPLVLAFSAQLSALGVNIVAVCEAAPRPTPVTALRLAGASGVTSAGLLVAGLRYHAELRRRRIPFLYGHMVTRAWGEREVTGATVMRMDASWRPVPGTERRFDVDTVCLGYGFLSATELSLMTGADHVFDEQLGGHVPVRDTDLRLSVDGVLVAGDGGGVRGAAVALAEGRLAGLVAAATVTSGGKERTTSERVLVRAKLARRQRFADAIHRTFPVGRGIYELAEPDSIVCRCEGVTAAEVEAAALATSRDTNSIKNVTRAGMGLCQGRNCARHVTSVLARQTRRELAELAPFNPRPPVKPVPISSLLGGELPKEP